MVFFQNINRNRSEKRSKNMIVKVGGSSWTEEKAYNLKQITKDFGKVGGVARKSSRTLQGRPVLRCQWYLCMFRRGL